MDIEQISKNIREMDEKLSINIKISHHERDRIIVERLIEIRNSYVNRNEIELKNNFDKVIRFWLDEDEFEKYVTNN